MVIKAMLRGLLTIEELNLLFLQVKGTLRTPLTCQSGQIAMAYNPPD
jgi:hypothetical protein